MMRLFPLSAFMCGVFSQPEIGPYETNRLTLPCEALDGTDPEVMLTYPTPITEGETFPLIAYAHGAAGGGLFINGYDDFFHQLASYGFVIAAHKSCAIGCFKPGGPNAWTKCADDVNILSTDGWAPYFGETLKTIEWALNSSYLADSDPVFQLIDFCPGVGIAGHSMGGQSSTMAANTACTKQYNIRAVALHHPATGATVPHGNAGSNISVPMAGFTSSGDNTCDAQLTKDIFNAVPSTTPKIYRNLAGSSHLEPVLVPPIENPYLATYTAAWFKIYLNGETEGEYYDLIYGQDETSICSSAEMAECIVEP